MSDADTFFAHISETMWRVPDSVLYGIDMDALMHERFHTKEHQRMVRRHNENKTRLMWREHGRQVLRDEQQRRMDRLQDKLAKLDPPDDAAEPQFEDWQLAVAMKSLEKNGR